MTGYRDQLFRESRISLTWMLLDTVTLATVIMFIFSLAVLYFAARITHNLIKQYDEMLGLMARAPKIYMELNKRGLLDLRGPTKTENPERGINTGKNVFSLGNDGIAQWDFEMDEIFPLKSLRLRQTKRAPQIRLKVLFIATLLLLVATLVKPDIGLPLLIGLMIGVVVLRLQRLGA